MAKKQDYAEYLKKIYDVACPVQRKRIENFLESGSLEYMGFDGGLYLADTGLALFEYYKDKSYLENSEFFFKCILKAYKRYKDNNAIPEKPITNRMFGISTINKTYQRLKSYGLISESEANEFYEYLVHATKWMVNYPEWGAHNRASIRGLGMYESYVSFPDREMSYRWKTAGYSLLRDNMAEWAMEDASTYHPIWVEDIYDCIDLGLTKPFPAAKTILGFYLDYFANTNNPTFIPQEYGDARIGTQWGHYVYLLEKGAKDFNNKQYKYVADRIFKKMSSMNIPEGYILNQSRALSWALECADDDIEMEEIYPGSLEAIEDVITKKIIFKNGLDETKHTSLFLNYKDEKENSYLGRKNLDYTICAPAEKNHHGHSDENSICSLTYKDSYLLHDGGYREKIDLLGAFRADFYHNKLVFRNECKETLMDTLRLEPYYNKVSTEKIYFYESESQDFSRTRMNDSKHGVTYDRCIVYMKDLNAFIVVDIVKSLRNQKLFISNQYFSQIISELKKGTYETRFEYIGTDEIKRVDMPLDKELTIEFLKYPKQSEFIIDDIHRSYTEEKILTNISNEEMKENEYKSYVTILLPNDAKVNKDLVNSFSFEEIENGLLVKSNYKGKTHTYCFKYDIEKNFIPERRPMYSFENTHIKFNDVDTDAIYLDVIEDNENIEYAFVFGSKVIYKDKALFNIEHKSDFFQADCSTAFNIGSYNYYQETIKK